jgi:hypothetical protein
VKLSTCAGVRVNAQPEVAGQVDTEEALPVHVLQWDAVNGLQEVEWLLSINLLLKEKFSKLNFLTLSF